MFVGIDLGTTFSVVAVSGRVPFVDGYPAADNYVESFGVTIVPNEISEKLIPSVVLERDGQIIVGMEAKQAAENGESPVMFSKRSIGTTQMLRLGQRLITAREAATEILKHLKGVAERALGCPIDRAVITHPAYFDRNQVEETRQAAMDAGFDMSQREQLLMEPVAAALAYTRADTKDPLRIMVFDLGGGTFDVTILERLGGVITCKAFDGDHLLGGYNFDRRLAQWIIDRLAAKGRTVAYDANDVDLRARYDRLLTYCEDLKIRLARQRQKKMPLEIMPDFLVDTEGRKIQVKEKICQDEFVALIADDITKSVECSRSCLMKAGLQASELDYVLLVGGSTHAPWIEERVREAFGHDPLRHEPDLCVGAGAAIHAAITLPSDSRSQGDLTLARNSPAKSVLLHLDIDGRLAAPDPKKLAGLSLLLKTPRGETRTAVLSADGAFLFPQVELLEEQPSEFVLQVINNRGLVCLEDRFTTTYAPDNTDVSTIQPVLVKSLYLKTAQGMRLLAEEGTDLPSADFEVDLVRLHREATLEIDIHQDDAYVANISINDIPNEAGPGSPVKLRVRITERNEIKGVADIYTVAKHKAKTSKVNVKLPLQDIPEVAELETQFETLENDRADKLIMEEDPARRALLANRGTALAAQIREHFRALVPDPLLIFRDLRLLHRIVNPPREDMSPPRSEFDSLLAFSRMTIDKNKDDPHVKAFGQVLDKCEREGNDAYKRKDPKKWAAVCQSLVAAKQRLSKEPEEGPPPTLPDTPYLKEQFAIALSQLRAELDEKLRTSITAKPKRESVFLSRHKRIQTEIERAVDEIRKVPDEMPSDQAIYRLQMANRATTPLRRDIEQLDRDVM